MLVHELIKELQELPPFMEVLIDVTPRGATFWTFKELNTVGEFQSEANGDTYVALACGQDEPEPDNCN